MSRISASLLCVLIQLLQVFATNPQLCYFGPGAANRAPAEVVPCQSSGESACCLLGDTCLSGNTCYNDLTGDLYQYGCTDVTYSSDFCPYKCGFNSTLSPWTALEYCSNVENVTDTWICHAPESCGCDWKPSFDLLVLQPRGCKEMGSEARVALYAPSQLAPYVSLPSTYGGETNYYSPIMTSGTSSWVQTAVAGYTPATVTELTNYGPQPSSAVLVEAGVSPASATNLAPSSPSPTASATPGSSATASASASASGSSNTTSPSSTAAASSSSGLSTGAKAGIGVGAAGGFCLIAAVAIAFFMWGRSQRKQRNPQGQEQGQHGPQYPGSPMQQPPYYPGPGDKPVWQGGYPMGHPQMQQYPYDVQPMYGGIPSPPLSDHTKQIPSPPMELSAEQARPLEMESSPARNPSTPSPPYAEVQQPKP